MPKNALFEQVVLGKYGRRNTMMTKRMRERADARVLFPEHDGRGSQS